MKILVVDDNQMHLDSAWLTLRGQNLTTASDYASAIKLLEPGAEFDAVLTDLELPAGNLSNIDKKYVNSEEPAPLGFTIALRAALVAIPNVAVVTATNHHRGAISRSFDDLGMRMREGAEGNPDWNCYWSDDFRPNFQINGSRVFFVHAPTLHEAKKQKALGTEPPSEDMRWAKDWGRVLMLLVEKC